MAEINLNSEKILSLNTELENYDKQLISAYFPEMEQLLDDISRNIQNDRVNPILNNIATQVGTIDSELGIDLPKLEQFLSTQMTGYQNATISAEERIEVVIKRMDAFTGKTTGKQVSFTNSSSQQGTNAQADVSENRHGRGEKYVETWESWWDDVSDAYSDTHGLFSAIGNTAEVVLDTAGAVVETAANAVSDVAGVIGDVVSWIFS